MEKAECLRDPVEAIADQTEQMERVRMVRGKVECLSIGSVSLDQATGLLMSFSLIKPDLDCGPVRSMSGALLCCLTASL